MAGKDDAIEKLIKENIEEYAALYTGRTKINRLLFLADKCKIPQCGLPQLELEALRVAYEEIRIGVDTRMFKEVVAKIGGRLIPKYGPNDACADVERISKLEEAKLKNDLAAYKTTYKQGRFSEITLNEAVVQKGYNDLGDFYYIRGQLDEAFDNYFQSRIYCTTPDHMVALEKCILVSIEMGRFGLVADFVSRVERSQNDLDTITIAKLRCAAGLAYLKDREYRRAADKFVETSSEIGNSYSEVIVAQDVANYGGLCALASFIPSELQVKVTGNSNFQKLLGFGTDIRELIRLFCSGNYGSCLKQLGKMKPNMLLDIHLHDHVEDLCEKILSSIIID